MWAGDRRGGLGIFYSRSRDDETAREHSPGRNYWVGQRTENLYGKPGANIIEGTNAAARKPFGFMPYDSGSGSGSGPELEEHCIRIDPFYLTYKVKAQAVRTRLLNSSAKFTPPCLNGV